MDYRKLLGSRIREIRKQKSLKQEQLAQMVALEPASICNIENGYNYPSFQNLEKIVCALGVSFTDVFEFDHHQPEKDLMNAIVKMLFDNPDKVNTAYKLVKALTE